jgi:hypothetical protein
MIYRRTFKHTDGREYTYFFDTSGGGRRIVEVKDTYLWETVEGSSYKKGSVWEAAMNHMLKEWRKYG